MKLLISNHSVNGIGGSEVHARTLASAFRKLGHDVTLCDAKDIPDGGDWDAAFLSQHKTVKLFHSVNHGFPPEKIVQTVHGLIPEEAPLFYDTKHVAVSEEVAKLYNLNTVILNPVDLSVFKPIRDLPLRPKRVLSLCQSESMNKMLTSICENRGLELIVRNKLGGTATGNIHLEMQIADIVVTVGRGVYEAMACGAAVLIADHRPYSKPFADGWAVQEYEVSVRFNCSGRLWERVPNLVFFKAAFDSYKMFPHWHGPEIIARNHDSIEVAEQYLELVK